MIRSQQRRRLHTTADHAEDQRKHERDHRAPRNDHDSDAEKKWNNEVVPKREGTEIRHEAAIESTPRNLADDVRDAPKYEHPRHQGAPKTCHQEEGVDQRTGYQRTFVLQRKANPENKISPPKAGALNPSARFVIRCNTKVRW